MECVYSSEEQVAEMLPLSKEQEENPSEFGVVDNFRCIYVYMCIGVFGHSKKGTPFLLGFL